MNIAAVALGSVVTFCAGGVVYGFNALYLLLVDQKAFARVCPDGIGPCDAQALQLNLIYTISLSLLFFTVFPMGFAMDIVGPNRALLAFGIAPFTVACGLAGFASIAESALIRDIFFTLALLLWGLCSPGVFLSSLSLSKLFPDRSAFVTSFIICLFDASSGMFFVLQLLHDTHLFSFRWLCWGLGILVLVLGIALSMMLPGKESVDSIDQKFSTKPLISQTNALNWEENEEPLSAMEEKKRLLREAMTFAKEKKFVAAAIFMSIVSLKNAFYIGSFAVQIDDIAENSSTAKLTNTIFNLVFPLGGIVSIPISSALLQNCKNRDDRIFGVVLFLALLHATLNMIPTIGTQWAAVVAFAFLRSLKWSTFSEFVIKRYPLRLIGSMFGISNVLFGLLNLLQFAAFAAVDRLFGGSFLPVNAILTVMEAACFIVPFILAPAKTESLDMK